MSATVQPMTRWWQYVKAVAGSASQKEIAEAAGVSQPTVSRWANGDIERATADAAVRFAVHYGGPVGEALVAAGVLDATHLPVTITKRENPSDEQLLELIAARLRRDHEDHHAHDTATSTRAGGSPATAQLERIARLENELLQHRAREAAADAKAESSRYALAARHGTPDHAPDTTTGEHSQDDGGFDPA